jgi:hypothetical protein
LCSPSGFVPIANSGKEFHAVFKFVVNGWLTPPGQ